MNITVAGAGAGKTTSMAKKVLDRQKNIGSRKIIYVVTYTNAARDRIREKVIEENGAIPSQICIETYHSFLLREFIFPYHHILYGNQYTQVTQITLSNNHAYKNIKIKELEANGQIHVEKVTEVAKWIVCGKSTDKKILKQNRGKILSIVSNYLDAVFVDEAQDIDEHLSQIIEALYQKNIHVALVGDPKQDLRGRKTFRELIQKYPEHTVFKEENHRCPISHVSLSNKFVNQKERQIPRSDQNGILRYLYEQDIKIEEVFERECWDHIYILKKNEKFITNDIDTSIPLKSLAYELRKILMNTSLQSDKKLELLLYNMQQICLKSIHMNNFLLFKKIEEYFNLKLSRKQMGALAAALNINRETKPCPGIKVKSIDRVKGLEGNKCMFIVTTDIAPYLLGENNDTNKMNNYLYVALTRAKEELVLMITKKVEEQYGRVVLEKIFKDLKIDSPKEDEDS